MAQTSAYAIPTLQELLEAGVHFGHQVRRGHPRMKPYLYGAREGVHIIDLTSSEKLLKEACEYAYNLGQANRLLLFVGTKKQAKPIIEETAKKLDSPYMAERWIGGFLTNFDEISKNIKKLKELSEQKTKGQLSKYTKKEQLLLDRQMIKLQKNFAGVMDLTGMPDAMYVIDTVAESTAVKEAKKMGIKVVAIADSNSDPNYIDYPIPGNDDAIKSIQIITKAIADAYEVGKKQAKGQADEAAAKAVKEAQVGAAADGKVDDGVVRTADEIAAAEEALEKKAVEDASRKTD